MSCRNTQHERRIIGYCISLEGGHICMYTRLLTILFTQCRQHCLCPVPSDSQSSTAFLQLAHENLLKNFQHMRKCARNFWHCLVSSAQSSCHLLQLCRRKAQLTAADMNSRAVEPTLPKKKKSMSVIG